jgi:amino acid transporter
MFRSFMRSTAPIALLLLLGICSTFAVLVLPFSTTTVTDGVETSSGPDTATLILVIALAAVAVLAFATAAVLTHRRRANRVGSAPVRPVK